MGRPRKQEKIAGIDDRWVDAGRDGKGKRWRLRLQGLPGHERPVTEYFDELQDAIDRRDELLRARSDPAEERVEAGSVTLTDIADAYLAWLRAAEDRPTEHYLSSVDYALKRAIAAGLDNVRDPQWPQNVQRWLANLTAQRWGQKDPKPASAATRRMYRAILGAALNYAVDVKEWLNASPFRKLKAMRTKAKRLRLAATMTESNAHKIIPLPVLMRLVSDEARWRTDAKREEAEAAVETCGGDKDAAAKLLKVSVATVYNRLGRAGRSEDPRWLMAVLMAYTGMRLGQTLGLEWADLDMAARTIRLRPEIIGNKSGVDATVEMEPELHAILEKTPRRGALVVPDPVEPNPKKQTKRPMRRRWLYETFDEFMADHGAGSHTAHDFRHSFVCMLTAMGIPTADVRRRVNHADMQMTARYADHLLTPYRQACAGWGGVLRLRESESSPGQKTGG